MSTNLKQTEAAKDSSTAEDLSYSLDIYLTNNTGFQLKQQFCEFVPGPALKAFVETIDPGATGHIQMAGYEQMTAILPFSLSDNNVFWKTDVLYESASGNNYFPNPPDGFQCPPAVGWPNTDRQATLNLTLEPL